MPEYTPTTEEVRAKYAWLADVKHPSFRKRDEFDRWLADHDKEVAAREVEAFAAHMREWYPEDVFPKPSDGNYHDLHVALARANITLDRFSADLMRRAASIATQYAADLRVADQNGDE